ncbi:hypothetical protein AHYW_002204 [Providencia manganoxydans]|uniref:hypothetical protein n=1 Tax=Providencia manganoxydans TaxID=2923283 RepID=UPI003DA0EA72
MPFLLGLLGGLFDFIVKKIAFGGWRFALFMTFWLSLYLVLLTASRDWLNQLLADQDVFRHEWWVMGVSLLPTNTPLCIGILGAAYSAYWLATFKRKMVAKYKETLDSK